MSFFYNGKVSILGVGGKKKKIKIKKKQKESLVQS
jgi:hypothetical protein